MNIMLSFYTSYSYNKNFNFTVRKVREHLVDLVERCVIFFQIQDTFNDSDELVLNDLKEAFIVKEQYIRHDDSVLTYCDFEEISDDLTSKMLELKSQLSLDIKSEAMIIKKFIKRLVSIYDKRPDDFNEFFIYINDRTISNDLKSLMLDILHKIKVEHDSGIGEIAIGHNIYQTL